MLCLVGERSEPHTCHVNGHSDIYIYIIYYILYIYVTCTFFLNAHARWLTTNVNDGAIQNKYNFVRQESSWSVAQRQAVLRRAERAHQNGNVPSLVRRAKRAPHQSCKLRFEIYIYIICTWSFFSNAHALLPGARTLHGGSKQNKYK